MSKNIALTYGDPNGIGPEVLVKALADLEVKNTTQNVKFTIFGDDKLIYQQVLSSQIKLDTSLINFKNPFQSFESSNQSPNFNIPGQHSYQCLNLAIEEIQNGSIQGLVTGPISKIALNQAGHKFPGQTELLSSKLGAPAEMLFQADPVEHPDLEKQFKNSQTWRIMLLTRHIGLKEVVPSITFQRLKVASQILKEFLKAKCQINNPKIALAAINPHAGENGEIGAEEKEYLNSWAEELGLQGPFSPDEIWFQSTRAYLESRDQRFDAYIAPYHDQVLPLIKSVTNLQAVNTSIGLPIIRTSPDHGTAYDLVGKNKANHLAYLEAIKACIALS